jgi:putative ABC transport system permease protein
MSTVMTDVRYGARLLLRSPGFTAIAIGALALGIGANTAIFSAIDAVLIRPLPYREADRLTVVWEDASFAGFPKNTPAPANFVDWRKQNQVFTDMAALRSAGGNLTGDGPPDFVQGQRVTSSLFRILGVPALIGRTLTDDDDRAGERVVILSYRLWQRRYGGDRAIIGRSMLINDEKHTVLGVMPRGFAFPVRKIEFWTPARMTAAELARRGSHYLTVVARLKPGVTLGRAQRDMNAIAKRLEQEYPDSNRHIGAVVVPLRDELVGTYRTGLMALLAGAACVLLIACANVANLLLTRAAGRQREMAVRAALGAGRRRLVRQLVTESVLLSVIGGGLGIALARGGLILLARLVPDRMEATMALNGSVLLFTAIVSIATGIVFGVFPAMHASRLDLNEALKQGGRGSAGSRSGLYRDSLVIAEVAIAIVLLAGAGLMTRTLMNMRAVELGFNVDNLLAMRAPLPVPRYADGNKRQRFYDAVVGRVRALPGVKDAAFANSLPFETTGNTSGFRVEGRPKLPNAAYDALYRVGTKDYLRTLGARLIEGRIFGAEDRPDSVPVMVVNETMRREYFDNESPLGHHISVDDKSYTIVGVVAEIRERGIDVGLKPAVYLPVEQNPFAWAAPGRLLVRADHDPLALAGAVRQAIWAEDRDMPVTAIQTMRDLIDDDFASREQQMRLLAAFAALALALAALGIYGVLSFAVAQRNREIGVRVALGATSRNVVGMVAGRGILLIGAGLILGTAISLTATRAMTSMLYGVAANDPRVYAVVALAVVAVALAACAIPASRAASVDPVIALREE